MSAYTTEVRFICEQAAGLVESEGYGSINEILDKARDKVFDFDFPIFDESYRNVLENKILKHYYTREIGLETVGLWKLKLDTRMNEIMPYYNQLYKSELIKFNPLYDVDLTTDYKKEDNGTNDKTVQTNEEGHYSEDGSFNEDSTQTGTSKDNVNNVVEDAAKNDHWDMYSDTPQGALDGIEDNKYLTNARHITDDSTGSKSTTTGETLGETNNIGNKTGNNEKNGENDKSSNSTANEVIKNVEDYLHHVVGKTGGASYSKLLMEFRESFLNIDMLVIDNLSDLFMNIW